MSSGLRWIPAYIGIGSNLNDPVRQVRAAIALLGDLPDSRLVAVSALYRNPPMGPQEQPDFINAVAGLLTLQKPEVLLHSLQVLETRLGRVRKPGDRWGPRIIDLDLLVYGSLQRSVPGLNLPHPGIFERNFVLLPLQVPGQGIVAAMAAGLDRSGLQQLD
jgi:2-amino-4-hydroxy-6-hydroxymethyldihydropteridine diphosphokinase